MPIWIADYVLAGYGTGAIMAVPAHDDLDWNLQNNSIWISFQFSKAMLKGNAKKLTQKTDFTSTLVSLPRWMIKRKLLTKWLNGLKQKALVNKKVTYRLRDWLFSRQRYWGEPIPIIHWEDGTTTAVPEEQLPLVLPVTKDIKPSGTGGIPLANLTDWLEVTRERGEGPRNQYYASMASSSWYYLRYIDPHNI